MWWLVGQLEKSIERCKHLKTCQRCLLYYAKELDACPRCHDLTDATLEILLAKRSRSRLNLGKLFFLLAAIIVVAMLLSKL